MATTTRNKKLAIAGIGASAGGLRVLQQIVHGLPEHPGLALIILQHLSADQPSLLTELLGSGAPVPVVTAEDGAAIEEDHVYVAPAGVHVLVDRGRLRIQPRNGDHLHRGVDALFRSLARDAGNRAIAVVLSGTATDGGEGVREVKANGGITLAQAPDTAEHPGMPQHAIDTGAIDLVCAPGEIAGELVRIGRHPYLAHVVPRRGGEEPELPDETLHHVLRLLHEHTGVDFERYKPPTIRRRLQRRMALNRIDDVARYARHLEQNPDELRNLYEDILIHVTHFFRDPDAFDALRERVLPRILERAGDAAVRVWTPGCATGEEAYSVAILVVEAMEERRRTVPVQIFATDLSEAAIDRAREAHYPAGIEEHVSDERLRRHFTRDDGGYQLRKPIRDLCIFSRQDLTRDPPFSNLDLIVCRNVLIYLGGFLQRRLMSIFHYALHPHGFLMLGPSENASTELFEQLDKKQRLYTARATERKPVAFPLAPRAGRSGATTGGGSTGDAQARRSRGRLDGHLLERFAPAAVLVDSDLFIREAQGPTSAFLQLPSGEASLSLLKMVDRDLVHAVRFAIDDARRTEEPAHRGGTVSGPDGERRVSVEVVPLDPGRSSGFIVLFSEDDAPPPDAVLPEDEDDDSPQMKRLRWLERELAESRVHMQSAIENLESTNEELQSANEEILSSNEELQAANEELDTAREELQSTNEELNTVNAELQARNEELSRANSDLVNLLNSVDIAIVIVDTEHRVRRFTSPARRLVNLRDADLGRPIGDMNPNVDCPDLSDRIGEVIDRLEVYERETRGADGRWYAIRIRPYKDVDNRIDGAIVAFVDIDAVKRQQAVIQTAREYAEAVVETVRDPLLVLDGELRVQSTNAAFCELFGTDRDEMRGKPLRGVTGGRFDLPALEDHVGQVLDGSRELATPPLSLEHQENGTRLSVVSRRIPASETREALILLAFHREPDDRGGVGPS